MIPVKLYYLLGLVVLTMSVVTINIGIYLDSVYLVVGGVIAFFISILRLVYVTILINETPPTIGEGQPLLGEEVDA